MTVFTVGLVLFLCMASPAGADSTWEDLLALADSLARVHRYDSAITLCMRAVEAAEKQGGSGDSAVALIWHDVGLFHYRAGRVAEAESAIRQALEIRRRVFGQEHREVAKSLNVLAVIYMQRGSNAKAELLFKEALAIQEKLLGPDDPDLASVICNLGILNHRQGRFKEAEALYVRALALKEKAFGPDHPELCSQIVSLADLYIRQERYREAVPLYERHISIKEKAFGKGHPDITWGLAGLARVNRKEGKYDEAKALYERALDIDERAYGPMYWRVGRHLDELSETRRLLGDLDESLELAKRAVATRRQYFRENAGFLSEEDAIQLCEWLRISTSNLLTCYFRMTPDQRRHAQGIADAILATKGEVSDGVFARHRSLADEGDSTLLALAKACQQARKEQSELLVSGPADQPPERFGAQLDSVSRAVERLESDLARLSPSFGLECRFQDISCGKLVSTLPENGVLIEYMRYDYYAIDTDSPEPRYLVMVVDTGGMRWVKDLGTADPIDSAVARYQRNMREVPLAAPDLKEELVAAGDSLLHYLYDAVWAPIASDLHGATLVLVAPDGAMNLISFGGLKNRSGRYLIEEYAIHYLSSGRDMLRLETPERVGAGLLVMGDPDYDAPAAQRVTGAEAPQRSPAPLPSPSGKEQQRQFRSLLSGCRELSETAVDRLPGTAVEVDMVTQTWQRGHPQGADCFLGASATEDNLKAHAAGKQVVHLATHGFYVPASCLAGHEDEPERFTAADRLLLSGLFLAGCNLHGEGAESFDLDDGVLTAAEVCGLNLRGVKWVVLSACESALGEVESGEGVYGLRRAFQLAGARTVISSLWPVADRATVEYIAYLYDHIDHPVWETVRNYSLAVLDRLRSHGYSDHPSKWAAFIACGDWR